MWRVTKTVEQKIGVQFAVHAARRPAHSTPWQVPVCFIINNNTTRLSGPFSRHRPRAIRKLRYTHRPARACPSGPSRGHVCHLPSLLAPPAPTPWGSARSGRRWALVHPWTLGSAPALKFSLPPSLALTSRKPRRLAETLLPPVWVPQSLLLVQKGFWISSDPQRALVSKSSPVSLLQSSRALSGCSSN